MTYSPHTHRKGDGVTWLGYGLTNLARAKLLNCQILYNHYCIWMMLATCHVFN